MKEDAKHLGLRINKTLLEKFHYASDYEGRSANGQLIYLIRQFVADFERTHGPIEVVSDQEKKK